MTRHRTVEMMTKGFQVNRAQDTSVDSPQNYFAVRRGAPADIRSIETHIATSFDHESRPEPAQVPLWHNSIERRSPRIKARGPSWFSTEEVTYMLFFSRFNTVRKHIVYRKSWSIRNLLEVENISPHCNALLDFRWRAAQLKHQGKKSRIQSIPRRPAGSVHTEAWKLGIG
ncbi:hypothetical protein B0H17DRAFT_1177552 [Mycena rosella]|uniref:Uncharacterized protein n=1 Tax=Mycena rosella TaxID=1033263 RepID=A0AAD7DSB2_MYCRO|nr:hypothetical protein B0H17DRAFT_1177552 [Mycena rosella]